MEHFMKPRNVGEIKDPDGVGTVGNPICGDLMTFYIKVEDDKIADIKFKTFGCGAAIAVSSILTEMVIGKKIEDALKLNREDIAFQLGGLPAQKMHCSNLGVDALKKAIQDYRSKLIYECPFCNKDEISKISPFCKICSIKFVECQNCFKLIPENAKVCPYCKK